MSNLFKLKNHFKERQLFLNRTTTATVLIFFLTFILICRLIFLQIFQHDTYVTLAHNNQVRVVPICPTRGLIYDRNGVLLAENIPSFSLEIMPYRVKNFNDLFQRLEKVIVINPDNIKAFQKQLKYKGAYESIPIKTKLTEEEVAKLSIEKYQFPEIEVVARLARYYPKGEIFAHALGYMGPISEQDLYKIDISKYRGIHQIGKSGIEKNYEAILQGQVGYEQVETDARGRVIRTLETTSPIAGHNIYLSIDNNLQTAAFNALANKQGAIVAIDVKTGDILALASNPSYDPNLFIQGINQETFQKLTTAPNQPLFNRAIKGQYPPGSIVKPLVALQALDHKIITAREHIYDPGYYKLNEDGRIFRDWQPHGHGFINLENALAESCSTFFYYIADKLGIERIQDIYQKFGLGQPIGIDAEEAQGIVPSPTWKRKIKNTSWYPGETLNTGIGQGYMLVTPVQVVQIASIIANKGEHIQLSLIKAIQAPNAEPENLVTIIKPKINLINEKNWDIVIRGMELAVKSYKGTAHRIYRANSPRIAGKTGTAQVFSLKQEEKYEDKKLQIGLRDHTWFMAFAPIEDPQIAIAAVIEHEKGSSTAVRLVLDEYLKEKRYG